jgi:hypothetical protein
MLDEAEMPDQAFVAGHSGAQPPASRQTAVSHRRSGSGARDYQPSQA